MRGLDSAHIQLGESTTDVNGSRVQPSKCQMGGQQQEVWKRMGKVFPALRS